MAEETTRPSLITRLRQGIANRIAPAGSKPYALPDSVTKSTQQQAYATQLVQNALQKQATRRNARTGQNGVASDASPLQSLMQTNSAPQANPASAFSPGAPMQPMAGVNPPSGPRQFELPVGYNINPIPRSTELTTAAQLRNLALLYDGIQLCEQVYFDILGRLEPVITFAPNVIPDGETEYDPKWLAITTPAREWVNQPDRERDLASWMCASFRDVLELGMSSVYLRRDRIGRIYSLEVVDAASIKVLADERGRRPYPPFPAYQQYLYGVPVDNFTATDMTIFTESSRSESLYPFGRIDRIIMRVNQALRKQNLDLTRYTDGSTPEGMLIPSLKGDPSDWTPEQIQQFEDDFNDLLAGNDSRRVRVKVGLPGATFIQTRPDDPQLEFDRFLLNITVGAFGLTMDEIAMTENSNRSVGRTQENVVYRRAIKPLANRYARFFTKIIQQKFDPRLIFQWGGIVEEEDILQKVQALEIGVNSQMISPTAAARMMNWPVQLEVPPMMKTKNGPIFMEDALTLRKAQHDSGAAALQFPVTEGDEEDEETDAIQKPPVPKNGPDKQITEEAASPPASAATGVQKGEELRVEYRRYYTVATKALKAGKKVPEFRSALIPRTVLSHLRTTLAQARTVDEVKLAFQNVRQLY